MNQNDGYWWPTPISQPVFQPSPQITWWVAPEKTALEWFEELVRIAGELDRKLHLPDGSSPAKTAWMDEIRQRIRAHESAEVERRLGSP